MPHSEITKTKGGYRIVWGKADHLDNADKLEQHVGQRLFKFFDRMLSANSHWDYDYAVLFSRGCFTLYKTVSNELSGMRPDRLMTDSGLLARAVELADYWKQFGMFPRILLLDDMVYHGRAIISFLSSLEKQLMPLLPNLTRENIRCELAKTVRSEAFIFCGTPSLLYKEYQKGFNHSASAPCDIREFRKRSQELTEYIADSDIVNSAYTVSARFPKSNSSENQIERCVAFLQERGYRRYRFINGTRVLLKCFPDTRRPKAILSIRILERKNSYWIVPYLFTAEFNYQELCALTRRLDQIIGVPFRGQRLSELGSYHRIQCELTAMMLNHLLLQYTLSGAGLSGYTLDWELIALNFGGDQSSQRFLSAFLEKAPDVVDCFVREWTEWLPACDMNLPLISNQEKTVLDLNTTMAVLEQHIYGWGIRSEQVARQLETGELTLEITSNGYKVASFSACLQDIYALLADKKWDLDVRRVTACLLYYMDHCYVAVGMHAANKDFTCCHYLRVSEKSLELLPKKSNRYLPLLVYMESFCFWGWERMKQRIEEYFGKQLKDPGLAFTLWLLTRSIHRSGQSFRDWCDWDEAMEATDPYIQQYKKWEGTA